MKLFSLSAQYSIVVFSDDSVESIPSCWITGSDSAVWPCQDIAGSNNRFMKSLITKAVQPTKDWGVCKLQKIIGEFGNLITSLI